MIRIYLLLVCVFCSVLYSNAQNWNFINANEKYHFQHVNDSIPLNTIMVDAISDEDSSIIYSLNRLFLPCDTCTTDETLYLANQPGFLQRELIFSQVSSTVVLNDPEENIIALPNSGIKEWWFNQDANQMATLDTIISTDVLGYSDSVAIISINGVQQIKIAKDLGLIKYFEYELNGLENANLGTTLPDWKDYYTFEVGDVFVEYEDYYSFGAVPPQQYTFSKYTITSVDEYADSLVIGWDEKRVLTYLPHSDTDSAGQPDFTTTIIDEGEYSNHSGFWNITENDLSAAYHNELKTYQGISDDIAIVAQFAKNNDQIELLYPQAYAETEEGSNVYTATNLDENVNLKYLPKRGLVHSYTDNSIVLETVSNDQIGFISNEDTTGFVFNDDFFEPKKTGNDFLSYSMGDNIGLIDSVNHEIYVISFGPFLVKIAEFEVSEGANAYIENIEQESNISQVDFNGYTIDTVVYTVKAENGLMQDWFVILDVDLSISGFQNHIKVYPNPTSGLINIEGVEGANIELYNTLGEKVYTLNTANNEESIVLDEFNHGIYFVKIIKGTETEVIRFIYSE